MYTKFNVYIYCILYIYHSQAEASSRHLYLKSITLQNHLAKNELVGNIPQSIIF